MPLAEIIGGLQLLVAVLGLRLQIMMTPDRYLKRTSDLRLDLGKAKLRWQTMIERRR